MKNRILFTLLVFSSLLNSCSTEFEVAAPYKEIPVIFGLISKDELVHYVKVNKAFLNREGSAIVAASVPDSNLYPYPISVKMYAVGTNGQFFDSVTFDTTRILKSDGIFKSNDLVYRTPSYKLRYTSILSSGSAADTLWANYTIIVRRVSDGSVIAKATTSVVGNLNFSGRQNLLALYNVNEEKYLNHAFSWKTARNGRRYDAFMRFKFQERNDALNETILDSLDYPIFIGARSPVTDGKGVINYSLPGEGFYRFLQNKLGPLETGWRREVRGPMEIHFQYAGLDLSQYMEINNNTVSLSDVKPEYTNVEGGYGIFSSRMRKVFNNAAEMGLNSNTFTELRGGCITGRRAASDCDGCLQEDYPRECGVEDLDFY